VIRKSFHYVIGVYDLDNVSSEGQLKPEGQGSIPKKRKKIVDRRRNKENAAFVTHKKRDSISFSQYLATKFQATNLNFHVFFAQLQNFLHFWFVDN
jgi:hypothetical protein